MQASRCPLDRRGQAYEVGEVRQRGVGLPCDSDLDPGPGWRDWPGFCAAWRCCPRPARRRTLRRSGPAACRSPVSCRSTRAKPTCVPGRASAIRWNGSMCGAICRSRSSPSTTIGAGFGTAGTGCGRTAAAVSRPGRAGTGRLVHRGGGWLCRPAAPHQPVGRVSGRSGRLTRPGQPVAANSANRRVTRSGQSICGA